MPKLTDFDGSNAYVSGGGTLALPALTGLHEPRQLQRPIPHVASQRPGSLSGSAQRRRRQLNGQLHDTNLTIQALAGGTVDFAGAMQIIDPSAATNAFAQSTSAPDGKGSTVNLAGIDQFSG